MRAFCKGFGRGITALAMAGALVSAPSALLAARPAAAHAAKCPHCKLDVVQDTTELDNEVALKFGRKRIEYRCVFCALTQALTEFKGDLTIMAPSEIKGKPVLITRRDGQWSVQPEAAVFMGHRLNHRQCHLGYRALTGRAAFDAWVKKHGVLLQGAEPKSLAQMLETAK